MKIMTLEELEVTFSPREKILYRALRIIGKMLRQNPMGDLSEYPPDLIQNVLNGGNSRDPNGKEYVYYFINRATKELREEGEI